jgi:hypothetical protein
MVRMGLSTIDIDSYLPDCRLSFSHTLLISWQKYLESGIRGCNQKVSGLSR